MQLHWHIWKSLCCLSKQWNWPSLGYLSIWKVWLWSQNGQKERAFWWETCQSDDSYFEKWKLFHIRNCQVIEDILQSCDLLLQTGTNQDRKRSGSPRRTTVLKYIIVSSLRNKHLTGPQLTILLNRTHKARVSSSIINPGCWLSRSS